MSWLRSMVAAGTPGVAAPSPGGVLVGGLECKKDIFLVNKYLMFYNYFDSFIIFNLAYHL